MSNKRRLTIVLKGPTGIGATCIGRIIEHHLKLIGFNVINDDLEDVDREGDREYESAQIRALAFARTVRIVRKRVNK